MRTRRDLYPDFQRFQAKLVKARRPWRCDNCDGVIEKGEIYERDLVWLETHATARYCKNCDPQELHWSAWMRGETYQ
jgi:hypothetical protein